MADDFRVATSFRNSRKRRRLARRLGADGVLALLDLWAYAAQERPSGVLEGLGVEDIADEVGWPGDADALVHAFTECGFIDCDEQGTYSLHGWAKRQPWVASSGTRSAAARYAAHERWAGKGHCKGGTTHCDHRCGAPGAKNPPQKKAAKKAPENNALCAAHADALQTHAKGNAPNPTPTPKLNKPPKPPSAASTHPAGGGGGLALGYGPAGSNPAAPVSRPDARSGPGPGAGQGQAPKTQPPGTQRPVGPPVALGVSLESLAAGDSVPGHVLERAVAAAQIKAPVGQGARSLHRTLALMPITAGELRYALGQAKGAAINSSLDGYLARVITGQRTGNANACAPHAARIGGIPGSTASTAPRHTPPLIRDQQQATVDAWRNAFSTHGYPPDDARARAWKDAAPDEDALQQLAACGGDWQRFDQVAARGKAEAQAAIARLLGGVGTG